MKRLTTDLTPKQARALDFISRWVQEQGYPPTFQELAQGLDLTEKNARDYVLILERKGYLRRQPNVARGLTLLRPPTGEPLPELPLVGRVMAGKPVEMFEHHEAIQVPPWLLRTGTHFVMEVQGDSMIDDGIREGDRVIVQQQMTPNNGEMVVAVVHGEATIKRLYRRGAMVELRPANARMAPLLVEARDVEVKGVVVGLIRKY
ncbi:MAG: transcriptional repressor LexA [Nitrospinae bacterium]|nr:transcriptional repressor LexA [Nitrospinota bacterium]